MSLLCRQPPTPNLLTRGHYLLSISIRPHYSPLPTLQLPNHLQIDIKGIIDELKQQEGYLRMALHTVAPPCLPGQGWLLLVICIHILCKAAARLHYPPINLNPLPHLSSMSSAATPSPNWQAEMIPICKKNAKARRIWRRDIGGEASAVWR